MPGAPAVNVTLPDSPGFNGALGEAISEPHKELLKSSGEATIPKAWNPFPLFVAEKVTSSPEFTTKSGLCPGSPVNALNARSLNPSSDSTKSTVKS